MSPRSRLRLSVDSSRSDRELADSQQFYQYTQHSPNTNRVFVDSKGQAHDPDFMSHMFPDQSAYKKRKMEAERARRASMGRHEDDDDYNSDDDLMSGGSNDPFRARPTHSHYTSQPSRNNHSSSYGSSSYSTPSPSWRHTSALLDENNNDDDDVSPTSERFSLRGWRRKNHSGVDCSDDTWDATEKSRRVLRRRRRDLEELEEDDDDDDDENPARESEGNDDAVDCAPTCTEALKQSWQGFVLRYKLGAHRLKRRMFPRKPEPQASTSPFLQSMEEKYLRGT